MQVYVGGKNRGCAQVEVEVIGENMKDVENNNTLLIPAIIPSLLIHRPPLVSKRCSINNECIKLDRACFFTPL